VGKLGMLRPFQLKTSILINLFYLKIPAGYKNIPDNNWPSATVGQSRCWSQSAVSQIMMSISIIFPTNTKNYNIQMLSLFLTYLVILSSFFAL